MPTRWTGRGLTTPPWTLPLAAGSAARGPGQVERGIGDLRGGVRAAKCAASLRHRPQPAAVDEERPHQVAQAAPVELVVRERYGGTRPGQPGGVLGLVVAGRVRVWHEDRRPADRGDLEHRAAGAGDHQVGGRDRLREVREVVVEAVARAGAALGEERSNLLDAARARDVDELEGRRVAEGLDRGE